MRHGHWAGIMVLLATAALRPPVAEACFCAPDCAAVATAEAIFEATVVRIESGRRVNANGTYSPLPKRVHLKDVRAWRGDAADFVMTGSNSCNYDFKIGTRYVIVASRDARDGQFWPTICSMTRPLDEAGSFREYVSSLSEPSRGARVWGRVASGRVVPLESGPVTVAQPIVGARVSLEGPVSRTLETGPDGRFDAVALPAGEYTIAVAMPRDAAMMGVIEARTITLGEGHPSAALDLWTRANGVVEGTVVDEAGQPVAGYLVNLQPVGYRVFGPRQSNAAVAVGEQTDADGRYRFTNVGPGRYLTGSSIMVGPTEREPFAVTYGRASSGETELVVDSSSAPLTVEPIVLRRLTPRRVTGRVRWADGQPAAGLSIGAAAVGDRGAIPAVQSARIGDAGGFALSLFDAARFEITVTHERRIIYRAQIVVTDEPIAITLPGPSPRGQQ